MAGREEDAQIQFLAAKELAIAALQVNPNDPLTLIDLAWIDTGLGQHDEARAYLDRAKGITPDDPYMHYIEGLMLNRLGDTDGAITAFKTAADRGYSGVLLRGDPNTANLRNDSRFMEITESP